MIPWEKKKPDMINENKQKHLTIKNQPLKIQNFPSAAQISKIKTLHIKAKAANGATHATAYIAAVMCSAAIVAVSNINTAIQNPFLRDQAAWLIMLIASIIIWTLEYIIISTLHIDRMITRLVLHKQLKRMENKTFLDLLFLSNDNFTEWENTVCVIKTHYDKFTEPGAKFTFQINYYNETEIYALVILDENNKRINENFICCKWIQTPAQTNPDEVILDAGRNVFISPYKPEMERQP